jgi:hypothetical protein
VERVGRWIFLHIFEDYPGLRQEEKAPRLRICSLYIEPAIGLWVLIHIHVVTTGCSEDCKSRAQHHDESNMFGHTILKLESQRL